jgi:hypothetical protein
MPSISFSLNLALYCMNPSPSESINANTLLTAHVRTAPVNDEDDAPTTAAAATFAITGDSDVDGVEAADDTDSDGNVVALPEGLLLSLPLLLFGVNDTGPGGMGAPAPLLLLPAEPFGTVNGSDDGGNTSTVTGPNDGNIPLLLPGTPLVNDAVDPGVGIVPPLPAGDAGVDPDGLSAILN